MMPSRSQFCTVSVGLILVASLLAVPFIGESVNIQKIQDGINSNPGHPATDFSSSGLDFSQSEISGISEGEKGRILWYHSFNALNTALKQIDTRNVVHVFDIFPAVTVGSISSEEIPLDGLKSVIDDRRVVRTAVVDNQVELQQEITSGITLNSTAQIIRANELHDMNLSGEGVKIAIIDTGVDSGIEAFQDRTGNSRVTELFVSALNDPNDDRLNTHATHVAGIAAGNGDYFIDGEYSATNSPGIAPGAEILSIRALDVTGFGNISWIIEGIELAVQNDADIISMSLSSELYEGLGDLQLEAISHAIGNDSIVVSAAGNLGPYGSGIGIPGAFENVITVGAVQVGIDGSIEMWPFSGVGPRISDGQLNGLPGADLVAPGSEVVSLITNRDPLISAPRGSLDTLSGTSMATPHISGGIALLKEAFPTASIHQIREALLASAVDLNQPVEAQGRGLADLYQAYLFLNGTINGDVAEKPLLVTSSPRRIEDANFMFRNPIMGLTKTFTIYLHSSRNLIVNPQIKPLNADIDTLGVDFGFPSSIALTEGFTPFNLNITVTSTSPQINFGELEFLEDGTNATIPHANILYFSLGQISRSKILFDSSKDLDSPGRYFGFHGSQGQFSTLAKVLEDEGHEVVQNLDTEITPEFLQDFDLVIIADPDQEYSTNEEAALRDFTQVAGKSLMVIIGGGFLFAEALEYAPYEGTTLNNILGNSGLFIDNVDQISIVACDHFDSVNRINSCAEESETLRTQDIFDELVSFPNFGPKISLDRSANAEIDEIAKQNGDVSIASSILPSSGRILAFSSSVIFDNKALTDGYGFDPADIKNMAVDAVDWLIQPRSMQAEYEIDGEVAHKEVTVDLHKRFNIHLTVSHPSGNTETYGFSQLAVTLKYTPEGEFFPTYEQLVFNQQGDRFVFSFTIGVAGEYELFVELPDPGSGDLISSNGHLTINAKLPFFDQQGKLRNLGFYLFIAFAISWIVWLYNEGGRRSRKEEN